MLEAELKVWVDTVEAFSNPIAEALNKVLPAPEILKRMAYHQVEQRIQKDTKPYLYWTGPFNSDPGQRADNEFSGTKLEDFWFWCTTESMTQSMAWVDNIRQTVGEIFKDNRFVNLANRRLVSAIYIGSHPVGGMDQTILTGQEFPMYQAVIGYTFGHQTSGS